MAIKVMIADERHYHYAAEISSTIAQSAIERKTGIGKRPPEQILQKMSTGKAIIALDGEKFAGFSFLALWENGRFVSNSGLIIHPNYRNQQLARRLKQYAFKLAQQCYPLARMVSLTTSAAVMKINNELEFEATPLTGLPQDAAFWEGCKSCINYDILTRTNKQHCLCTGMIHPLQKTTSTMKVVLAYSGGLDTSFCIPYLKEEKGLEVYTAFVDTSERELGELLQLEKQAYQLGAKKHETLKVSTHYYQKCIKYLIWGNILRNNTYPLSVSSERFFQALALIEYAKSIGAQHIAHGSTGVGNDQLRFDLAIQVLAPEIKILAPIRSLQLSRNEEIAYLQKLGVEKNWEKAQYSVNEGLWGTSVGGKETLTSHLALPESAYPYPLKNHAPQKISLHFENGELTGINETHFNDPVEAIKALNQLANDYAIGRDIHVGDTIIGLKGRVGFSAAAALIIIKAHELLEKHTLSKWQQYWKAQVANWYGMQLHEGQYLDPVMRDIEQYLESSQKTVSGQVFVELHPYRFELQGISSPNDLMQSKFGNYGETTEQWTAQDAEGFIKLMANPLKNYYQVHPFVSTTKEVAHHE